MSSPDVTSKIFPPMGALVQQLGFPVTVFKCPYEIRQFCLFSFRAVFEGGFVQCISCLESIFCHANVVLFLVLVLNSGLVNYVVF